MLHVAVPGGMVHHYFHGGCKRNIFQMWRVGEKWRGGARRKYNTRVGFSKVGKSEEGVSLVRARLLGQNCISAKIFIFIPTHSTA